MDIKPIRNQRDYKAALTEIDRLFDAHPRTPEADLLEVWVTLVEAYEQRKSSIHRLIRSRQSCTSWRVEDWFARI